MSLCFLKAFTEAKAGSLTHQEYIKHLTSHFRGVRHPQDSIDSVKEPLASFEPWVASFREVALTSEYEPLDDTSGYENLFELCFEDRSVQFKSALQDLRRQRSQPDPLQPAACLAAQKQHLDILKCCLDEGAVFDRYLNRAAQLGARGNTTFLEFLLSKNWADIQSSPDAVQDQIKHFGDDSMESEWLRKHAGAGLPETKPATSAPDTKDSAEGHSKNPKGSSIRDPKQGYTPEQIQEWFGDIPW